jgi:hypothetical protein
MYERQEKKLNKTVMFLFLLVFVYIDKLNELMLVI